MDGSVHVAACAAANVGGCTDINCRLETDSCRNAVRHKCIKRMRCPKTFCPLLYWATWEIQWWAIKKKAARRWYWPPSTRWRTPASYLQVKDAELHSIRRLAVGQEVVVIEDAADSLVWWGGFGLRGQGRGFRVYSVVQVPEQRHVLALWCFNMTNNVFIWLHCVMSKWWISSFFLCRRENKTRGKKWF